ncbi:unnamed protein product [Rodentolepis nana]|uniref:Uncharacterized protein n=1 Tax=Rodentolepis nana TaxID=102285 RepID=A0A0R3TC60_RODNA|nr:unnamed protein product [Rodentolepis nana]
MAEFPLKVPMLSFSQASREREDSKRRERAWASISETAKRNPLYSLVINGGDVNSSSSLSATMDTTASGPSPNSSREIMGDAQRNGLEEGSSVTENDEDVSASLRSLQRESEEELRNLGGAGKSTSALPFLVREKEKSTAVSLRRKSDLPQDQGTIRTLEQHRRPDQFLATQPDQ